MITKTNMLLLLKRAALITLLFLAVGFALDIAVNGFSVSEAAERLVSHGIGQSVVYAFLVAVVITPFKSGS